MMGGGIAGLASCHYLSKLPQEVLRDRKIILLESCSRTGKWLKSSRLPDGVIHELGPRSIRTAGHQGVNTLNLLEDLDLENEVIGFSSESAAAKNRMIWFKQKLVPLPSSLSDLFRRKEPLNQSIASLLFKEVLKPRFNVKGEEDISVYDFFEDRLGTEVAEFISDPLCRGITAGDARKLSMKAMFPDIFNRTLDQGSLVKGLLFSKKTVELDQMCNQDTQLVKHVKDNKWIGWSLKNGLQSLPDRLTHSLQKNNRVKILTDSKVESISCSDSQSFTIKVNGQPSDIVTDELFSTLPAYSLASCLNVKEIEEKLLSIPFVDVAVAVLEFKGFRNLNGFGFLVPSSQEGKILGITFDSCSFPDHDAGQDITRVTCMMGGAWFQELFGSKTDDVILSDAIQSTKSILGWKDNPIRSSFCVHKKCIPQYYVGHCQTVKEIKELVKGFPPSMYLLGSSFDGISVNDVIFNAKRVVLDFQQKHS